MKPSFTTALASPFAPVSRTQTTDSVPRAIRLAAPGVAPVRVPTSATTAPTGPTLITAHAPAPVPPPPLTRALVAACACLAILPAGRLDARVPTSLNATQRATRSQQAVEL